MIINAGGGDGCTYVPRYTTQEKHEPKRHKMFKIKTTFIKVHGVGSLAVISFPLLENRGVILHLNVCHVESFSF